jgi:hypothetical protein
MPAVPPAAPPDEPAVDPLVGPLDELPDDPPAPGIAPCPSSDEHARIQAPASKRPIVGAVQRLMRRKYLNSPSNSMIFA